MSHHAIIIGYAVIGACAAALVAAVWIAAMTQFADRTARRRTIQRPSTVRAPAPDEGLVSQRVTA